MCISPHLLHAVETMAAEKEENKEIRSKDNSTLLSHPPNYLNEEVILTSHHTSDHLSLCWHIVRKRKVIRHPFL